MGSLIGPWGELRCSACIAARRYSKILCKYRVGSLAPAGEIEVRCQCGHLERLTMANQSCDGVRTFQARVVVTT